MLSLSSFRASTATFLRIALPYFRSDDRWAGCALLAAVIALQLFQVWVNVRLNIWNNAFYNALQEKNWDVFLHQLVLFSGLAALFILTAVYQLYLSQWLQIRWRRWMTAQYLDTWLTGGTHYRMRLKGDAADNPDQRIADDVQSFISSGLDLGISALGAVITLASFVVILWGLSPAASFTLFGQAAAIPGYLVWTALIYAAIGTVLTHLVGRPLVRLNFDQQRYEADFRFSLVRLRENAEEVALLKGESAEGERLSGRFGRIVGNWFDIMRRQKRLTFLTSGYGQIAIIFPFLVVSPLYFAGTMELGGLMQTASAFGQVQTALSFFVTAYASLAAWKAVLDRLSGFETSLAEARKLRDNGLRLTRQRIAGDRLMIEDLSVMLPDGRVIVRVPHLSVKAGERALLMGPSGAGKSSLFRALGGIWPHGAGRIAAPGGARIMVLPQRPYLPLGTLRGVLAYPALEDTFTEAAAGEVLEAVGLAQLKEQLNESGHWTNRLSVGEQQRLAVARALLHRPDWLMLDEATSALDEASEAAIYRLLDARLPHSALLSIGHRQSLMAYHARLLVLRADKAGPYVLTEYGDLAFPEAESEAAPMLPLSAGAAP